MGNGDPLIGQTLHDSFVIRAKLGEGGMGRVYLAEHVEFSEKKYAIKVLRPELTSNSSFRQRFYEEARHQAKLDHPNIVQMVDFFNIDRQYFLVLDYVDGASLADLIDGKWRGGMPERQALKWIRDVLAGLDCAHQKALLHRDVKSSNVLVDNTGRARLTDFGITLQASGRTALADGTPVGTPEYMSPEQLDARASIDHRSDVYSAGIVLYEMLTGKLPYYGDSFDAIQAQQLTHPVPNPRAVNPKISKRVAEIVQRAMQKAPVDRFQGGPQFIGAIDRALAPNLRRYALAVIAVLLLSGGYAAKTFYRQAQMIRGSVSVAAHDYNFMCREQKLKQGNEAAKRIADVQGFSDLSESFARHVQENDANMAQRVASYEKAIRGMGGFNRWTVRRVLGEPSPTPETEVAWPLLAEDYERYVASGDVPTTASMLRQCGRLGPGKP